MQQNRIHKLTGDTGASAVLSDGIGFRLAHQFRKGHFDALFFCDLFDDGQVFPPARLPEEEIEKIRETAVRSFVSLNLKGYARIDMFVRKDGRVAVLEPNTLPGMTPSTVLFHQAAACGITQAGLIDRIIQSALEVHSAKRGPL